MLLRRVFDRRADHLPPWFEPGSRRDVRSGPERWIAQHHGIEGGEDAASVGHRPFDRVIVFERAVFRVRPVDLEPDPQAPRSQVAARRDIISGKEMNDGGGDRHEFTEAQFPVRIESRGA